MLKKKKKKAKDKMNQRKLLVVGQLKNLPY